MSNNFQFKFSVICDDSRREDNGKIILIGIYGSHILVRSFPALLHLSPAIFFDTRAEMELKFSIEALLDENKITGGQGTFPVKAGKDQIMLLPRVPLKIEKEGLLRFRVREEEGEWVTIAERPIKAQLAT